MKQEPRDGEPIHLELVDALELYAAIVGGTVEQAADWSSPGLMDAWMY